MSTLRFTDSSQWRSVEEHLAAAVGERFAFALTRHVGDDTEGPVLVVDDVLLIGDEEVEHDRTGWSIKEDALDRVHNRALGAGAGLVEFHNHHLGPPGFSRTDEKTIEPMASYVIDMLGKPYGAAVWAHGAVHADWFRISNGQLQRGTLRSVTVVGDYLRVLNAEERREQRFDRQIPIVGAQGQAALLKLRVAVVGNGGTGSHAVSLLSYLGVRDLLLLDSDLIEASNLNRVVTAEAADVGAPKTFVARRRVLSLDRDANVRTQDALSPTQISAELLGADLIVGCVDHDGPRHRLNQVAVEMGIPYVDMATGVDPEVDPVAVGGRVAFVLPGGPCLGCTEELASLEVARWYKPADQQALDRRHGYGMDDPSPSVVHLNGLTANAAMAEIMAWISGVRPPALRLDIDLVGESSTPGVRVAPSGDSARREGCVECSWRYQKDDEAA